MIATPTDLLAELLSDLNTAVGGDIGPLEEIAEEYVAMLERIFEAAEALDIPRAELAGRDAEAAAGITGVFRLSGAAARAVVTLTGAPGTPIPGGSRVASVDAVEPPAELNGGEEIDRLLQDATTADVYETASDATLEAVRLVEPGVNDDLEVGELFTVGGTNLPGWVFECTGAGDLGTVNLASLILAVAGDTLSGNGTATFRAVGRGTAAAEVTALSVEALGDSVPVGALAVLGSTNGYNDVDAVLQGIVSIESPVPGWRGVLNRLAGDAGRIEETDARLLERQGRSASHDLGNSYNDGQGVEATLLRIPGVTAARVVIDEVAHTAALQVVGGDSATIARAIHRVIPHALTLTADDPVTTETEDVVRADRRRRTIVFQRPAAVTVNITATVVIDPLDYVGDDALTEQLQGLTITSQARLPSQRLQFGEDVYASRIACELLDVEGVLTVDKVKLDGGDIKTIDDYEYAAIGSITLTKQVAL